jgi:putative methanogenesis marker protein 8
MSRHVVMCCGARVEIVGTEVRVLDEPLTRRCPLQTVAYGYEEIDRDVVKRKMEMKIGKLGFASKERVFITEPRVPYGASEMIMSCLEEGVFDCAVTVCEGAGTVLASTPQLVQMIGAFLSGIVETTPVPEIIEKLKESGGVVLDESAAAIDQVRGVELAAKRGHKRIAVTVAGFRSWEIPRIRELEERLKVDVTVFAVCTTKSEPKDAQNLLLSDLVWACNSKVVREMVAPRALLQLGVAIPVFALTDKGKRAIFAHLMKMKEPLVAFRTKLPYLVPARLPG